jgi:hypothetical protein
MTVTRIQPQNTFHLIRAELEEVVAVSLIVPIRAIKIEQDLIDIDEVQQCSVVNIKIHVMCV